MAAGENTSAVIGKSVEIRGEVKGSEDLLIDGHVEGTITLTGGRLTIGAHANVTANVAASDVIVLGRLNGNIRAAGRVELRKGCDLVGDIATGRLTIDEAAFYRGKVDLLQAAPGTNAPGASSGSTASGAAAAGSASAADKAPNAEAPLVNTRSK